MRTRTITHLYPSSWRARYGDEFEALLEDLHLSPRDTFDVLVSAFRAQIGQLVRRPLLQPAGGPTAPQHEAGHALLAATLMLPTLALLVLHGLKFKLGVEAPFDVVWFGVGHQVPALQYAVVLLPVVALVLAARDFIRIRRSREEVAVAIDREQLHRSSVVVALASLVVLGILLRYFFGQHLITPIEAPWPWFPPPWDWWR